MRASQNNNTSIMTIHCSQQRVKRQSRRSSPVLPRPAHRHTYPSPPPRCRSLHISFCFEHRAASLRRRQGRHGAYSHCDGFLSLFSSFLLFRHTQKIKEKGDQTCEKLKYVRWRSRLFHFTFAFPSVVVIHVQLWGSQRILLPTGLQLKGGTFHEAASGNP